jgi:hypothetical protein
MGKGTFFYVHGAGNREADAVAYANALRAGLGLLAKPDRLQYSNWGARTGPDPTFPDIDKTLPLTPHGLGDEIEPAAADSLAPLRALAAPAGIGPEEVAVAKSPDVTWLVSALRAQIVDLSDVGISPESLRLAAERVAASPAYAAAEGDESEVFDATLTSIVATALEIEASSGPAIPSLSLEDVSGAISQAVGAAANRILGSVSTAIVGWVGPKLKPAALLAISRRAATERRGLMHSSGFLVPADILYYQRRGAAIRSFVRTELAKLDRPVVALGHSLGGIILVDTLFGPEADAGAPDADLLVTFGSQAPMLAAVGAIDAVVPSIPWVNIWTLYDFVSFRAQDIWPGAHDEEIMIEVGFPDSHGAYYTSGAFFDRIKAQPLAASILA